MHPWTPYWFADELPSLAHAVGWLLVAGRWRGWASSLKGIAPVARWRVPREDDVAPRSRAPARSLLANGSVNCVDRASTPSHGPRSAGSVRNALQAARSALVGMAGAVGVATAASARAVWGGAPPGWAVPDALTWLVLVAALWGSPRAGASSPWRVLPLGLGVGGPWAFAAGVALAGIGATTTRWARAAFVCLLLQGALHGPLAQRAWTVAVGAGASFDAASVGLRVAESALIVAAWCCVGVGDPWGGGPATRIVRRAAR